MCHARIKVDSRSFNMGLSKAAFIIFLHSFTPYCSISPSERKNTIFSLTVVPHNKLTRQAALNISGVDIASLLVIELILFSKEFVNSSTNLSRSLLISVSSLCCQLNQRSPDAFPLSCTTSHPSRSVTPLNTQPAWRFAYLFNRGKASSPFAAFLSFSLTLGHQSFNFHTGVSRACRKVSIRFRVK